MSEITIFEAVQILRLPWENKFPFALAVEQILKARLGVHQVLMGSTDLDTGVRQELLRQVVGNSELFEQFQSSARECVLALRPPFQAAVGQAITPASGKDRENRHPFEMLSRAVMMPGYIAALVPVWNARVLVDLFLLFPSGSHGFVQRKVFMNCFIPHFEAACNRIWLQDQPATQELATDRIRERGLSHRQSEIVSWVLRGKTNSEIATILGLSLQTIKNQVSRVYAKLGLENRRATFVELAKLFR